MIQLTAGEGQPVAMGAVPPNFCCYKISFKHIIKTKIFTPKKVFCPTNLKTWLRSWEGGISNRDKLSAVVVLDMILKTPTLL